VQGWPTQAILGPQGFLNCPALEKEVSFEFDQEHDLFYFVGLLLDFSISGVLNFV
jgi:hypothetical protein